MEIAEDLLKFFATNLNVNPTPTLCSMNRLSKLLLFAVFVLMTCPSAIRAADTEPLKLNLPVHTLKGTPEDLPTGPNIVEAMVIT